MYEKAFGTEEPPPSYSPAPNLHQPTLPDILLPLLLSLSLGFLLTFLLRPTYNITHTFKEDHPV